MSSQEIDGAGASTFSEKDRQMAKLAEELNEREEELDNVKKQLQAKATEATSLEEKKLQLEQQLTHMVDSTALLAQKEEFDKAQQDMMAERRYYKAIEAQNVTLQGVIQQLKQQLSHIEVSRQGGNETVPELKQQLREKEEIIQELSRRAGEKSSMVDESHDALQETTGGMEKTLEEMDTYIKQQMSKVCI